MIKSIIEIAIGFGIITFLIHNYCTHINKMGKVERVVKLVVIIMMLLCYLWMTLYYYETLIALLFYYLA